MTEIMINGAWFVLAAMGVVLFIAISVASLIGVFYSKKPLLSFIIWLIIFLWVCGMIIN